MTTKRNSFVFRAPLHPRSMWKEQSRWLIWLACWLLIIPEDSGCGGSCRAQFLRLTLNHISWSGYTKTVTGKRYKSCVKFNVRSWLQCINCQKFASTSCSSSKSGSAGLSQKFTSPSLALGASGDLVGLFISPLSDSDLSDLISFLSGQSGVGCSD